MQYVILYLVLVVCGIVELVIVGIKKPNVTGALQRVLYCFSLVILWSLLIVVSLSVIMGLACNGSECGALMVPFFALIIAGPLLFFAEFIIMIFIVKSKNKVICSNCGCTTNINWGDSKVTLCEKCS